MGAFSLIVVINLLNRYLMPGQKRKQIYDPKPHLTICEDATGYLFTTRNEPPTKAAREAIRLINQSIPFDSVNQQGVSEDDSDNGTASDDNDVEKMIAKEKQEFQEENQKHAKRARHIKTIKNYAFIHCLKDEIQPQNSLRQFISDFAQKEVKFLGKCMPVFATCRLSEIEKGVTKFEESLKTFFESEMKSDEKLNFKWSLSHEVKNSDFFKFDSITVPVRQMLWKTFPDCETVYGDEANHVIKLMIIKQFCYFCFMFEYADHNKYVFATGR